MNSSYSEETCSPLQLHPPPWKSRFSGPANLAQAVWMEVLWVSLPQKYLWNASPGSDFIGMTQLGQGQKKNPSQLVLAAFLTLEQVCVILKTYQAHL